MDEEPKIAALDVAGLQRWLDDPEMAVDELLETLPFLRDEADARAYLGEIRVGLEDIKHGRTVSHEQVRRDVADRRRYRATAAE